MNTFFAATVFLVLAMAFLVLSDWAIARGHTGLAMLMLLAFLINGAVSIAGFTIATGSRI